MEQKKKITTLEVPLVQEEHAPDEPTQNVLAQDVFTQKMLAHKYWILGGSLAIIGVLYLNRNARQLLQEPLPKQIQKVPDPPTDPFSVDNIYIYIMDSNTIVNGAYHAAVFRWTCNNKFFDRKKTTQS